MEPTYSFYWSGVNGNYQRALMVTGSLDCRCYNFGIFEIVIEKCGKAWPWETAAHGAISLHDIPANRVKQAMRFIEGLKVKGDVAFCKDVQRGLCYVESVEEAFFTL